MRCLRLILCVLLMACAATGAYAMELACPGTVRVGEDFTVRITGLSSDASYSFCLSDRDGYRVCNGYAGEIEDGAVSIEYYGDETAARGANGSPWTFRIWEKGNMSNQAVGTIQAVAAQTAMPGGLTVLQWQEQDGKVTASFRVKGASPSDRVRFLYAFFPPTSGSVSQSGLEEYVLDQDGCFTFTLDDAAGQIGLGCVSVLSGGVWSHLTDYHVINAIDEREEKAVAYTADNPPLAVWEVPDVAEGNGVMVYTAVGKALYEWNYNVTVSDGKLTFRGPSYQGEWNAEALLLQDGRIVRCATGERIARADGKTVIRVAQAPELALEGTLTAGRPLTVRCTHPSLDVFSLTLQKDGDTLWEVQQGTGENTIPGYFLNEEGTYTLTAACPNGMEAVETIRVTAGEQPLPPSVAVPVMNGGLYYFRLGLQDGEEPCEVIYQCRSEYADTWGTEYHSTDTMTSAFLIRADMYVRSGRLYVRACTVRDGVASPWAGADGLIGMPEDKVIRLELPESAAYGEGFTVTAVTDATGYCTLVLNDTSTGETVYQASGAKTYQVPAYEVLPGTYQVRVTCSPDYEGTAEIRITGTAPETPTARADRTTISEPGMVTFTVHAPGAQYVYLDSSVGIRDTYAVQDGTAVIPVYLFSGSGTALFSFRSVADGVLSAWSESITITADIPASRGATKATLNLRDDYRLGGSVTFSVEADGEYLVRVLDEYGVRDAWIGGSWAPGEVTVPAWYFTGKVHGIEITNLRKTSLAYEQIQLEGEYAPGVPELTLDGEPVEDLTIGHDLLPGHIYTLAFSLEGAEGFSVHHLEDGNQYFPSADGTASITFVSYSGHGGEISVSALVDGCWTEAVCYRYHAYGSGAQWPAVVPSSPAAIRRGDALNITWEAAEGAESYLIEMRHIRTGESRRYASETCSLTCPTASLDEGVWEMAVLPFGVYSGTPSWVWRPFTLLPSKAAPALVLPAGTQHIGESAFEGTQAVRVLVPEGTVEIGARAFAGCTALREIVLPASVRTIAADAFAGTVQVTVVTAAGTEAERFAGTHGMAVVHP